jgi:hypothetical protein
MKSRKKSHATFPPENGDGIEVVVGYHPNPCHNLALKHPYRDREVSRLYKLRARAPRNSALLPAIELPTTLSRESTPTAAATQTHSRRDCTHSSISMHSPTPPHMSQHSDEKPPTEPAIPAAGRKLPTPVIRLHSQHDIEPLRAGRRRAQG